MAKLDHKFKVMYQVGLTKVCYFKNGLIESFYANDWFFSLKVFLREALDQHLEQQRQNIIQRSALLIQKTLRMLVVRRKYLKLRKCVTLVQSRVRARLKRL